MPENKDEIFLTKEEAQKKLLTYKPQEGILAKLPETIVDQGESQYDTGFVIPEDSKQEQLNEYRAQHQSTLDRWGNSAPRLVSKTATEVAKIPGYLGGGLGYLTSGDLSAKNFADYIDNGWIDTLNNLDEKTKETFKVYTPKAVKEGNLWDNLTSASFWTTEGVDGAGFLLAALAPGGAIQAAKIGAKVAKGLDLTAKTARNIDLGLATGINTTYEAMSEANGIVTNLKDQLIPKVDKEINPKTNKLWTREEVDEAIGNAGVDSFLSNMLVLAGPNLLMNKNLLGKFNTTKTNLSKITDASGNLVEAVTPVTKKAVVGNILKSIGLNAASEGLVEEGSQFAIENFLKKQALGQTDKGFLEGFASEYLDALGTTEGQKSIALGALFGSVSGSIGTYREGKQEEKQLQGLRDLLNSNLKSYSSNITDLYARDENGDILTDEDNKPIKDSIKIAEVIENKAKAETRSQIKDSYAVSGNKEMFDFIRNDEFTDFAMPYLSQDGGIELLDKHIDNLSENLKRELEQIEGVKPTSKQDIAVELKQKARKLQEIHDKVELYGPEFTQLETKSPEEKQLADSFLDKIKYTLVNEASRQNFYKERLTDLTMQKNNLLASGLPLDLELEKQVSKNIEQYSKALEESIKNYKDLLVKDNVQKLFDSELEKYNAQREQESKTTEERKNKTSDIADKIDNESELTEDDENFISKNEQEITEELVKKDKEKEANKTKNLDNYILRHNLKEGGQAKFGELPVTIEIINTEEGTAIVKVKGSENDVRTVNIKELYKSNEIREDFVDREQSLVSEALTNSSKGLTEETANQITNDKLTTNTSDSMDQESLDEVDNKGIGKVSNVVMFKQFLGSIEYVPLGKGFKKVFKWTRGDNGLPKPEDNRSEIDYLSLNDSSKVKPGTKVYFKFYDLDEPSLIRKQAILDKNKELGQPYPEIIDIGIFLSPEDTKPIGFVQLAHPVIKTPDESSVEKKIIARQNLIQERANIIERLQKGEEVSTTITQKGTGKLITRLTKDGKVALKDSEGNYINLFSKLRDTDSALNRPIFVYNSGTGLTIPTIQESGNKKQFEKKKEELSKQVSKYFGWGNPGQVFVLVKSLNGEFFPAPVYSTPINSKTSERILDILRQNSKADAKTIINKLQPYVYASLSEGAHKLIIEKAATGDVIVRVGTAGDKINISTGFSPAIQTQLKNEIESKLKHNIDITNINTKITQDYLRDNNVLTTNIDTIDGEFFGQPYIAYNSLLERKQQPLAKKEDSFPTDLSQEEKDLMNPGWTEEDIYLSSKADINKRREEELDKAFKTSKNPNGPTYNIINKINEKYDIEISALSKEGKPIINEQSLDDLIKQVKNSKNPFASSKEARQRKSGENLFGLDSENLEFHINTLNVISQFLENVGVETRLVPEFLSQDGSVIENALAAANFLNGTVDIIEDIKKRPSAWNKLPEEAAHFWYRLLKNNSGLKKDLWESVRGSEKLKELTKNHYSDVYEGNEEEINDILTEEAIGQLIAENIKKIEEKNGSPKDYSFFANFLKWVEDMLLNFKSIWRDTDPFEVAAIKILSSDMSDLMTYEEYKELKNKVYFDSTLTDNSVEDIEALEQVSDNLQMFKKLIEGRYKKKSKFLKKTIDKFYTIQDAFGKTSLSEWVPRSNKIDFSKQLTPREKENLQYNNNYGNVTPALKGLSTILDKFKKNPISLNSPFKLDGVKKEELNIYNSVLELIKKENPELKSIKAEDFVAEIHNYLELNYLLGFGEEKTHLGYRITNTFKNQGNVVDDDISPLVSHRKISLRFNDSYFKRSTHFSYSPSAWGNLTPFYSNREAETAKKKDYVLLHEIQNDNIEFLRNLFKDSSIGLDEEVSSYLSRLERDYQSNIRNIETGNKRAIKKISDENNPLIKTKLDNILYAYTLSDFRNGENYYNEVKSRIQEEIDLFEANDYTNQLKAYKKRVDEAYQDRQFLNDLLIRGGIKSLLSQEDLDQIKEKIDDINSGTNDVRDKHRALSSELYSFNRKISNKIFDKYNREGPQLLSLRSFGKGSRNRRNPGNITNILDNINSLIYLSEKQSLSDLNKRILEYKKEYYQTVGKEKQYLLFKKIVKLSEKQILSIKDNLLDNIKLLNSSIELAAKKELESFQTNESAEKSKQIKELEEQYSQIKSEVIKNKEKLGIEWENKKEEISNRINLEMNYFNPLVHHLIQTHIKDYGKNTPLIFSGYEITMLTQGNSSTANIYAGPEEVKKGISSKVGPLWTAMNSIPGIKLEYSENLPGFTESVGGYIVNLENYQYKSPILYGLNNKKDVFSTNILTDSFESQEEENFIKNKLPQFTRTQIENLKTIHDRNVLSVGMFRDLSIYIANNAPKGTTYHEAFHAVYRTLLSENEQVELQKEARTKYSKPTQEELTALFNQALTTDDIELHNLYYEEKMAESFKEYMNDFSSKENQKKTFGEQISNFFSKLLDFINSFFNSPSDNLDILFSKIRKGEFKNKKPSIIRPQSYLNDVAFSQIPGFTDREKNENVITIGNYFINSYFQQINNGTLPSKVNVVEIFQDIYKEYKGITTEEGLNPKQIELANNIVNQFNLLKKEVSKFLLTKGIKINNDVLEYSEQLFSTEGISDEEIETLESNITKSYGSDMTSIPGLSSASTRLKLFLSSIPVTDENGDIKTDILGMPVFHDFISLYYYIEKNLIGFKYYDNMIEHLELLSEDRPELKEVISRLNEPSDMISEIERKRLQSDFKANFSKQNLNYILTLWEKEGENGFTFKVINSNREGLSTELLQRYKNNLLDKTRNTISEINKETGETISIGTTKAKKLRDAFKKVLEKNKTNTEKLTLSQIKNITSDIGIDYSKKTIEKLFKEQPTNFYNNLELVLNWYAEGSEYYNFAENRAKRSDEEGALRKLVSIEISSNYDLYTSSFTNIEKKQIYSIQLPSYLSKQMDTLTGDNFEEFEEELNALYKDPSYKYNNVLSDILKDNKLRTEEFRYFYTDGLKNSKGDNDGKGYTAVKDRDFLAQQLAMFVNGNANTAYYNYLINADKSLNTLFKFKKYGVNTDEKGNILKDSEIVDSFYNVFLSEYERIKSQLVVKDKYAKGEINDLDLIENYHYKRKSKPSSFNGKAYDFNHFSTLNKKDIKDRIFSTIGRNIDSKDALIDLQEEIKDIILAELQKVHKAGIKEAIDKKIISREEGELKNNFIGLNTSELLNPSYATSTHKISQILASFNLNSFLMNIEFSKLFNGDDAIYRDLFKRTYQSGAMTVHSNNKKEDKIKIILVKDEFSSTEPSIVQSWEKGFKDNKLDTNVETIKGFYSSNNITDAQVWVNPTLYKRLYEERGMWSEAMERAHNLALNPTETIVPEEISGLITGIKPFGFGKRFNDKLGIWQYEQIKCAIMPLYPIFNKDNPLMQKNYELMEKTGVQMIAHESAFKAASQGKLSIDNLTEKDILDNFINFDANYFGFQVDNPNHSFEEENNAIRQIKMLMLGNIDPSKEYNGRSGKEIRDEINEIEAFDITNDLISLMREITGQDKTKFREKLIESLTARKQFTENIENALTINGKGNFEFPLDFGPFSKEIQNLISSMFTKKVLLASFKGGSAVQVSSLGMKFKNLTEQQEEVEKNKNLSILQSELKTVRFSEDGKEVEYAEAIMPAWAKDFFDENGLVKSDIPEDLKKILIYRIPTEGFHSMLPIKVVKFLPATYGNFILLPYEVTTQFGADFDFDKMYFIVPEYSVTKDGLLKKVGYDSTSSEEDVDRRWKNYISDINSSKKVRELLKELGYDTQKIDKYVIGSLYNTFKKEEKETELTSTLDKLFSADFSFQDIIDLLTEEGLAMSEKTFKELPIVLQNSKKARKNRILDNYLSILASPNTIEHILNPSGFSELERIKNTLDAENKEFGFKEEELSFYTGQTQREYKRRNHATITGKGQAALHVTGHSYGTLLDLDTKFTKIDGTVSTINSVSFNDKKNITSLSNLKNFKGELISKKCASLLAAILDDIKNPIMYELGINTNTLDIFMTLTRFGFEEETIINFLTQPIVREISSKLDNNLNELKEKGFKYYFIDETINSLMSNEALSNIDTKVVFDNIESEGPVFSLNDSDLVKYRRANKANKDNNDPEYILGQLKVAYNFKKYDQIAKSASKYNKFFAINKEVGPNIENIDELMYIFAELSAPENIVKGIENIDKFPALNSYEGVQREARGFLSTFFPYTSGVYSDIKSELGKALLKSDKRFSVENRTVINNFIGFYLGLKYPTIGLVSSVEEKESLLKNKFKEGTKEFENLSLGSQILSILNPANDENNLYSNGEKIRENKFLQMLTVVPAKDLNGVDIIRLKGGKLDNFTKDDLKDAILDLYNREETKELAIDLVKYSYLSSGFFSGFRSFYQVIPVEILRDINYHTSKQKDIEKLDKGLYELSEEERDRFVDQFIRNNPKFTKSFDLDNFIESKEDVPKRLIMNSTTIKNKEIILGREFIGEIDGKNIYRNIYPKFIRTYNEKARRALLYKQDPSIDSINNINEQASYSLVNTLGKSGDFLEFDIYNNIEESIYNGNNVVKNLTDDISNPQPEDNYSDTESFLEKTELPENEELAVKDVTDSEVKRKINDCE